MDTKQLTEYLMPFGLTRQESSVYLCLAQHGNLTGYETAKLTNISRSNAYSALSGLVDKGAAYTEEHTAVRYHAVGIEEFCSNKIRTLTEYKKILSEHMPKKKASEEGYLTITGDRHIQDKIKNMILASDHRIYLSMAAPSVKMFEAQLKELLSSGKKVVVITDEDLPLPNAIIYRTKSRGRQISVIADSISVLTGEFGKGDESICLYSGQKNFVQVLKDSMRNEIKLIQLWKGDTTT